MPEMNWDAEKGTVTLVKGDDTKIFDLNKEEDRISMMKMGQRGWYYDDEASKELGQLRGVIKNWDSAIEAAKNDDEAMKQLVGKIELAVGRSLTKAEKREMSEGEKPKILMDDGENEGLLQVINSLNKKIEALEKSQQTWKKETEDKETQAEVKKLNAEADALEKKYKGDNGTPKFDRDSVFEFCFKNGVTDLELAFKMMNYDKLTEAAKKDAIKEYKEQTKDRQDAFVLNDDHSEGDMHISKDAKAKSIRQVGEIAFKDAKETGLSFFTDD